MYEIFLVKPNNWGPDNLDENKHEEDHPSQRSAYWVLTRKERYQQATNSTWKQNSRFFTACGKTKEFEISIVN